MIHLIINHVLDLISSDNRIIQSYSYTYLNERLTRQHIRIISSAYSDQGDRIFERKLHFNGNFHFVPINLK